MNHRWMIAALLCGAAPVAWAQAWPAKPVRIINPFPAGGGMDTIMRPLAVKLTEWLGQTVVVDNRPGANGLIGHDIVAKAAPDGYTLVAGTTGGLVMNYVVLPKTPFHPQRDFQPVTNIIDSAFILSVHPSLPVRSLKELVALAKRRPGELNMASFGLASSSHFALALFELNAGVKVNHVPYKGSAPASADLVAGHVMMLFDSFQSQAPLIRAGRVRPLALAAATRVKAMPDLPTFAEVGIPGVEAGSWYGLLAPGGTPREIVDRLHAEVTKAFRLPDMRSRFEPIGADIVLQSPERFAAQIRDDMEKWSRVAKAANIRAE